MPCRGRDQGVPRAARQAHWDRRGLAHFTVGYGALDDPRQIDAEPFDAFPVHPAGTAVLHPGNNSAAHTEFRTDRAPITSFFLVTFFEVALGYHGAMPNDGDEHREARAGDAALARAFGFLGKRWNGLILGTLTTGPAGFAELRRAVVGISDSVLSERLSELSGAGLVQRTVNDGPPVSVRYQLTPAGLGLIPAMRELISWATANLPAQV